MLRDMKIIMSVVGLAVIIGSLLIGCTGCQTELLTTDNIVTVSNTATAYQTEVTTQTQTAMTQTINEPTPTVNITITVTPITTSPPTTTSSNQYLVVTYSGSQVAKIQSGTSFFSPSQGNMFEIINFQVANHGYSSVYISSLSINLLINNVIYDDSWLFTALPNYLAQMSLSDGGTVTGTSLFEIPLGTTSFIPYWVTYPTYNIQWVNQSGSS